MDFIPWLKNIFSLFVKKKSIWFHGDQNMLTVESKFFCLKIPVGYHWLTVSTFRLHFLTKN